MSSINTKNYSIYYQTQPLEKTRYFCFPEDHKNKNAIYNVAQFIENHYQDGDLVVVENFKAGEEVAQTDSVCANYINKKVKVIGSDIEEMSIDSGFKPGTVSDEAYKLSLRVQEKFIAGSLTLQKIKKETEDLITKEIFKNIENFLSSQASKRSEEEKIITQHEHESTESNIKTCNSELPKTREEEIQQNAVINLNEKGQDPNIQDLITLNEIDIDSEIAIKVLNSQIEMINETYQKLAALQKINTQEIDSHKQLQEIYLNFISLKLFVQQIPIIQEKCDRYCIRRANSINSYRIIKTFPDRIESMIQTLDNIPSTVNHIFIIWGKNHFIEGEDAKNHPEMKLEKFYNWAKDKSIAVLDFTNTDV